MCNNLTLSNLTSFSGFKVVAKKNNNYYSIAIGFKYQSGKKMFKRKKQKVIAYFGNDILRANFSGYGGFRKEMVGRTSVFKNRKTAINLAKLIKRHLDYSKNFDIVIIKATIKGKLYEGTYHDDTVFAGETLIIDKEI